MDDQKRRILKAIEKFSIKENPARKKRTHTTPERDLQQAALLWMNANGFDVQNVETKATYSLEAGGYKATMKSMPDIIGNDNSGRAVYVELKAPGRMKTLKNHQREFLLRKIQFGCFALCADSIELIDMTYKQWQILKANSTEEAKNLLLEQLPPEHKRKDNDPDPIW